MINRTKRSRDRNYSKHQINELKKHEREGIEHDNAYERVTDVLGNKSGTQIIDMYGNKISTLPPVPVSDKEMKWYDYVFMGFTGIILLTAGSYSGKTFRKDRRAESISSYNESPHFNETLQSNYSVEKVLREPYTSTNNTTQEICGPQKPPKVELDKDIYDISETRATRENKHLPDPVQITKDPADPWFPDASKDKVTWEDCRSPNGRENVYTFNVTTGNETQITDENTAQRYPTLFDDKIAWQDHRNGNADIYLKWAGPNGQFENNGDPNSDDVEVQITNDPGEQKNPELYGDNLFWDNESGENRDIFVTIAGPNGMFEDVNDPNSDDKEVRITSDEKYQGDPAAGNGTVSWVDERESQKDIWYYGAGQDGIFGNQDDVGEVQITDMNIPQAHPAAYEDKIVWEDGRFGNADIFLFNTTTGKETRITDGLNQTDKILPAIYKNIIIWIDKRNTNDVYMRNLGPDGKPNTWDDWAEIRLTNNSQYQRIATISKDNVYWEDTISGNHNIHMMNLSEIKNGPPVLDIESQLVAYVGKEFNLKVNTSDPESDRITHKIEGKPESATFDNKSGEFSWTPPEEDNGKTYNMKLYVKDGWGGFDEKNVEIKVNGPVDINITKKDLKAVPGERFSMNISDIASYVIPEGGEAKFSDNTDMFDIDPITGEINFTPKKEDWGYHEIKIKVEDGHGGEDEDSFYLTVDTPPKFKDFPEDQTIETRKNFHYRVTIEDPDIDQGEIEFSDNAELFDIDNKSGEINLTPEWGEEGEYEMNISVKQESCGQKYNLEKELKLKIIRDNYPPEFENLPEKLYSEVGKKFKLDVNATDKDNDTLEYSSDFFEIDEDGNVEWIPKKEDSGLHEVEFGVSDGKDEIKKNVELRVNMPPRLKVKYWNNIEVDEPVYVQIGNDLYLKLSGLDEDGSIDEYGASPNIFGNDFSKSSGEINNWIPGEKDKGKYFINFSVEDNEGAKTTKMVEINVLNESEFRKLTESFINHPPEIKNLPKVMYLEVGKEFELNMSKFAEDKDDDNLTYYEDSPFFEIDKNGKVKWIPKKENVGEHKVAFGVSDGEYKDEEDVTLMVNASEINESKENKTTPEDRPSDSNNNKYIVGGIISSIIAAATGLKIGSYYKNKDTKKTEKDEKRKVKRKKTTRKIVKRKVRYTENEKIQ